MKSLRTRGLLISISLDRDDEAFPAAFYTAASNLMDCADMDALFLENVITFPFRSFVHIPSNLGTMAVGVPLVFAVFRPRPPLRNPLEASFDFFSVDMCVLVFLDVC